MHDAGTAPEPASDGPENQGDKGQDGPGRGTRGRRVCRLPGPLLDQIDRLLILLLDLGETLVRDLASGEFLSQQRNVVLVGGTGTGKTHISVAIARAVIRNGARGRFFNVVDLVNRLETEARAGRAGRLAEHLMRFDFVILDELGSDNLIAGILNRNGLLTGHGNRWTRERVTSLRSHHKIPVFRPAPDGIEPWLNLTDAARLLGVSPKTRMAAETGVVKGDHPLSDGACGPRTKSPPQPGTPCRLQSPGRLRASACFSVSSSLP